MLFTNTIYMGQELYGSPCKQHRFSGCLRCNGHHQQDLMLSLLC